MRRQSIILFSTALACGPIDETESVEQDAIINGVQQHLRTEIGDFIAGCTATVIDPEWILMAAHCMSYMEAEEVPGGNPLWFRTSANGVDFGSNGGETVGVRRTYSLSTGLRQLGATDVMLARLDRAPALPAGIIPAGLATSRPLTNTLFTIWGRGCLVNDDVGTGSGIMRWTMKRQGHPTNLLCPGDSGGPTVHGFPGDRGLIFGVNSGFANGQDVFGDTVLLRSQIFNIVNTWNAGGDDDIFTTGWCTGSTERMIFGDLDGDQDPDAICHDSANGRRATATNTHRLIREVWSTTNTWCGGTGDSLFVGDFNGDAKTDLFCFNRSTGLRRIDFVNSNAEYLGTNWQHTSTWCTQANRELHIGDFNGDGRSDLLCRDLSNGFKWIDYADASGHFDGTNWLTTGNWCSHTGARLYTGDSNGDGKTDLICHTPSSGAVDVDLSAGGSSPFSNTNDHELRGPQPPANVQRFCDVGTLQTADYDGDGRSDLLCQYSATDTYPSIWSTPEGDFDWRWTFGWGGAVRVRRANAASQPWQMPR
jgi:hypothetical protein